VTLPPATTALPVQTADADTALTALLEFGAKIKRNEQGEVVGVNLFDTKITDAGLVHLKGLTRLQVITPPTTPDDPDQQHRQQNSHHISPGSNTGPQSPHPSPGVQLTGGNRQIRTTVPPLARGVTLVIACSRPGQRCPQRFARRSWRCSGQPSEPVGDVCTPGPQSARNRNAPPPRLGGTP